MANDAPNSTDHEKLVIGDEVLSSRLFLGSGHIPSLETLDQVIEAAAPSIVTVALRRIDPRAQGSILDVVARREVRLLPNTAGCFTAREAVLTAQLAREAFETDWVKLEVIGDEQNLMPDALELLEWLPPATLTELRALGHELTVRNARTETFGYGQAVMSNGDGVHFGASDPRTDGAAVPQSAPVLPVKRKSP